MRYGRKADWRLWKLHGRLPRFNWAKLVMILATMMLLAAQPAPTVAAIQRLSPNAAGDVALAGRDHNPITEVAVRKEIGPQPPGLVELEMVERAILTAGGCARRRWTVSFSGVAPAATRDATLSGAYAATEVALRRGSSCPQDGYVHLNGGLEPAQALAGLAYLNDIRLRRKKADFSCSDSTSSQLCANARTMRQDLANITPWAVKREGDVTTFWLGEPGHVVTEMRYSASHPANITVTRRIPAPF